MTNLHTWVYPWDIARRGARTIAEEFVALGVNAASITTVYHSAQVLSLISGEPEIVFPSPGVPLWEAEPNHLPGALNGLQWSDFLSDVADAFREYGIALRAWTIAYHDKYDMAPVMNAFGQALPHAPCPLSNARWLSEAAQTIAGFGVFDALEVESPGFVPAFHGYHHDITGIAIGTVENLLLGLCFCETCCRAMTEAGIDSEALKELVRRWWRRFALEGSWGDEPFLNLSNLILAEAPLATWLVHRAEIVENNVVNTALQFPGKTAIVGPALSRPARNSLIEGGRLVPSAATDKLESVVLAYSSPRAVRDDVRDCLALGWHAEDLVVGITLVEGVVEGLNDVMMRVNAAWEAGARRFSFYNYGLLSKSRREWIGKVAEWMASKGDLQDGGVAGSD